MKRPLQKFFAATIMAVILMQSFAFGAGAAYIGDNELSSQGAVVIDYETGQVLYGYLENTQRAPASMMKVLAVAVFYDTIRSGAVSMDTLVGISHETSVFSVNRTWSNVPLVEGEFYTFRDLLEVVLIRSACAATVALGEAIFGSEKALMEKMKEKAALLGVAVSIYDSWGGSPDNRISPYGLAVVTRSLISLNPEVIDITSKMTVTFNGVTYGTSNLLMGQYEGLDGLKTGFTNPAGYCFIGTARRNGRRIISVTMGSSLQSRYPDTRALLDYGFDLINAAEGIGNSSGVAQPSGANLIINGSVAPLTAYFIDDYHYFRLRDVAFLLTNTEKRFGASWDGATGTGTIITGISYVSVGGELNSVPGSRPYERSQTKIIVDGVICAFEVYMIDDNNYFRFRDLAELFNINAIWVGATNSVVIDTTKGWEP